MSDLSQPENRAAYMVRHFSNHGPTLQAAILDILRKTEQVEAERDAMQRRAEATENDWQAAEAERNALLGEVSALRETMTKIRERLFPLQGHYASVFDPASIIVAQIDTALTAAPTPPATVGETAT